MGRTTRRAGRDGIARSTTPDCRDRPLRRRITRRYLVRITSDEFFETRKDWSRRKHLVLLYYLRPAIAKLRSASPDGRVVILDGFAGPGRYEDGTTGSPAEMGQLADALGRWANPVDLKIINIEPDPNNHAGLEAATKNWVDRGIVVNIESTFVDALNDVLATAGKSP